MASKEFYHDINLLRVSQLRDFRVHNVTTTERGVLAAALGAANEGLHVWDTEEKTAYYWNGVSFQPVAPEVAGAMIYKGAVTSLTTAPIGFEIGYTYVFTGTAGTLTWAGQTFLPDAEIQSQDLLIYRGDNIWDIYEGDDDYATETEEGNIRIATQSEVNAGTVNNEAVTPATLNGFVSDRKLAKTHFATVDVVALVPFTVTHNLNLQNKDSFVCRTATSNGSSASFDIDSVDVNSFTITSAVSLTGIRVFTTGF